LITWPSSPGTTDAFWPSFPERWEPKTCSTKYCLRHVRLLIPYYTQSTVAKSFFESPRHWTIASPPTLGTLVQWSVISIGLLYQLGYLLYFLGRSFYWFDISATWGQFSNSSFSTSSGSPNPLRVLPGWSYFGPRFFPSCACFYRACFFLQLEDGLFWEERFSAYPASVNSSICFCCSGIDVLKQTLLNRNLLLLLEQPVSISSTVFAIPSRTAATVSGSVGGGGWSMQSIATFSATCLLRVEGLYPDYKQAGTNHNHC